MSYPFVKSIGSVPRLITSGRSGYSSPGLLGLACSDLCHHCMAEPDHQLTEKQELQLVGEITDILWEFARDGRQTGYNRTKFWSEQRMLVAEKAKSS